MFFLQIDETTDTTKKAQLLGVVRFVDGNSMREHLFCEELLKKTAIKCLSQEHNRMAQVGFEPRLC